DRARPGRTAGAVRHAPVRLALRPGPDGARPDPQRAGALPPGGVMTTANASAMKGHRWFAAVYGAQARRERPAMVRMRRRVAGGASGRVLEIGAGTGANLPFYPNDADVVATEPDPFMLRRARAGVAQQGRTVELHQAPAEALPFPAASFDTVVSTLVLC